MPISPAPAQRAFAPVTFQPQPPTAPELPPVNQGPVDVPVGPPVGPPVGTPIGAPLVQLGTPMFDAITRAGRELDVSAQALVSIPAGRAGDAEFTPVRRAAYDANMRAQNWLESQFLAPTTPLNIVQVLREADAKLEYANWKTVGKDPRSNQFVGYDIPGALNDTIGAVSLLTNLTGGGAPVPPGPTPPTPPGPTPPGPTPPTPPRPSLPESVLRALSAADGEIGASLVALGHVDPNRANDPSFTPVRKEAYAHNMNAQKSLEQLFNDRSVDPSIVQKAHDADAQLELANWNTVGKDPRTQQPIGVDMTGSIAKTTAAHEIISALLTGVPSGAQVDPGVPSMPAPNAPNGPAPIPAPGQYVPQPGNDRASGGDGA